MVWHSKALLVLSAVRTPPPTVPEATFESKPDPKPTWPGAEFLFPVWYDMIRQVINIYIYSNNRYNKLNALCWYMCTYTYIYNLMYTCVFVCVLVSVCDRIPIQPQWQRVYFEKEFYPLGSSQSYSKTYPTPFPWVKAILGSQSESEDDVEGGSGKQFTRRLHPQSGQALPSTSLTGCRAQLLLGHMQSSKVFMECGALTAWNAHDMRRSPMI